MHSDLVFILVYQTWYYYEGVDALSVYVYQLWYKLEEV